jgi:retron-type reverse transcriptase
VREAARQDSTLKFTALLHHVNEDCLTEAFFNLKRTAAVGVDGVTWHEYERNLEANLADLHDRIHRGAYRAQPSRRVWIPKADGRQRPLGIATLEDKIVQQAVLWVLQSIYEQDFLGFSYGFRPGRSQHDALDALSVAIASKRVNWILDADIEGFFDTIDHEWLCLGSQFKWNFLVRFCVRTSALGKTTSPPCGTERRG